MAILLTSDSPPPVAEKITTTDEDGKQAITEGPSRLSRALEEIMTNIFTPEEWNMWNDEKISRKQFQDYVVARVKQRVGNLRTQVKKKRGLMPQRPSGLWMKEPLRDADEDAPAPGGLQSGDGPPGADLAGAPVGPAAQPPLFGGAPAVRVPPSTTNPQAQGNESHDANGLPNYTFIVKDGTDEEFMWARSKERHMMLTVDE